MSLPPPQGIQDNIEDWERVLRVHSLVLSPKEEVQALCRYASICRKSGRMVGLEDAHTDRQTDRQTHPPILTYSSDSSCSQAMANRTLVHLLGVDPNSLPQGQPLPADNPMVSYVCIKHQWHAGQKASHMTVTCYHTKSHDCHMTSCEVTCHQIICTFHSKTCCHMPSHDHHMSSHGCHMPSQDCHMPSHGCHMPSHDCHMPSHGCDMPSQLSHAIV